MSNERNKVTDKAGEIARNIWLAGVGAYGRAVEDAQERLEKAMEPPKLFRDLVKAGAALEEEARGALQSTAAARQSVEERISRVRENFHMQRPARIEDLAALQARVDDLAWQVDALRKALQAQGVVPPSGRRATQSQAAAAKPARAATAGSKAARDEVTQKKAGPRKAGARKVDSRKTDLRKTGSRKTGSRKATRASVARGKSASATAASTRGKRTAKKTAR